METILTQFASAEAHAAEKADLFSSLGIDWKLLILQTVAFLILLVIFSALSALSRADCAAFSAVRMSFSRLSSIADKAEKMTNELMRKARAEASDIVAAAREEAASVVEQAAAKATAKSETIVSAAQAEIAKEVEQAKKALHNETLELVAEATGKVLHEKVDAKTDATLIATAVKEVA